MAHVEFIHRVRANYFSGTGTRIKVPLVSRDSRNTEHLLFIYLSTFGPFSPPTKKKESKEMPNNDKNKF